MYFTDSQVKVPRLNSFFFVVKCSKGWSGYGSGVGGKKESLGEVNCQVALPESTSVSPFLGFMNPIKFGSDLYGATLGFPMKSLRFSDIILRSFLGVLREFSG